MTTKNCIFLAFVFFLPIKSNADADWRFYANEKDGYYFLSDRSSKNHDCKGMKEASQQRLILNEFKYIRELCYIVLNSGKIKFLDPQKIFPFNRFEVNSSNFSRIPTKEERVAAEAKRLRDEMARSLYEVNRSRQNNLVFSDNPTMLIIDGDIRTCQRIGGVIDCF